MMIETLYRKDGKVFVLDQRLLPQKIKYIACRDYRQVAASIRDMAVRGAPAIGVAAAFGLALAAREKAFSSVAAMRRYLKRAAALLAATRPTAVNLFWAIERMRQVIDIPADSPALLADALDREASAMFDEDVDVNRRIGDNGAGLIGAGAGVLTHCNAGALATAGYGTALGVIRSAHQAGKVKTVFVDETRPYLQGARLTAWEMKQEGIPHVLITDNMAGYFMQRGLVDAVVVGADRIALNGDTANKIGTYSLSVLAHYHRIPFYVAAPVSTIDPATPSGDRIAIEERSSKEVTRVHGKPIAPAGTVALHPAFDVAPAKFITAIVTEQGVYKPREIRKAFGADKGKK